MKDLVLVKNEAGIVTRIKKTDPRYNIEFFPIAKNKVTVKDSQGNTSHVSINDERYISGELVHYSSGNIWVKFEDKIFQCKPNDPNVLNKTYQLVYGNGIYERQRSYRDKQTGEKIYLFICDEMVLSGRAVPILTEYITAKDATGKCFAAFKDDERFKTREIFPATTKYISTCEKHGRVKIVNFKSKDRVQIPEKYKIYCQSCIDEFLSDEYVPTETDIETCRQFLNDFVFVTSNQQNDVYFKKHLPQFFKIIDNIKANKFSNKIYMFKNNLTEPPKCKMDGCNNLVPFIDSTYVGFPNFCEEHKPTFFSSEAENQIISYISEFYKGEIIKNYRKFGKEIDIFLPEKNLGIEYNGLYWHTEEYRKKNNHYDKWAMCKENNIFLISIWEDEWNNKNDIVKSILNNALKNSAVKIYARKCVIKKLDTAEKVKFLNDNHMQGNCQSSVNLGLFYNEELVSMITFGKRRRIMKHENKINEYELLRFCSKLNCNVIGGASKLFNYFIKNYDPENIISFANLDISQGNIYNVLGFREIGHTGLNYWWYKNGHRYHRSNFMKHKLVKNGADPSKTENQIMYEDGYFKIWGTGNLKFEWNK